MKINDRIFNELQQMTNNEDSITGVVNTSIIDELIRPTVDRNDYNSDEDYEAAIDEQVNDDCNVLIRIPADSLIERALLIYYHQIDYEVHNLSDVVKRNGWFMDDDGIYFLTGIGYNWIDSDLLDGDGSNDTIDKFLTIINDYEGF